MEPKVSVIIPVYNVEQYLRECLDSVLGQTLKEIEVICVDDGSTDHSLEILREYEKRDSRVKVLTQPNTNAGAARNHGLKYAKGKYLSFLDSDDFFEANMLEKAYQRCERDNLEIVVFRSDQYVQQTKKYQPAPWTIRKELIPAKDVFSFREIEKDRLKCFVGWAWDKLFLRSFVEEHQLTYQEQRTTNDMFFVFAALSQAQRIGTMEDILAHQRKNSTGTLSVTREKSWDCFYHALNMVSDFLKKTGTWGWMEQDFANYTLNATSWNLSTIAEPARKKLYDKLQKEWLFEFGVHIHPAEDYYNQTEYQTALRVMALPYDTYFDKEPEESAAVAPLGEKTVVSVLIPSCLRAGPVEETLKSLCAQTLGDVEILYVDGGKEQTAVEAVLAVADKDPRVKVVRGGENLESQVKAGLQAASGAYIGMVRPGDWVKPNMYEDLWAAMKAADAQVVLADYFQFQGDKGKPTLEYCRMSTEGEAYGTVLSPSQYPQVFWQGQDICCGLMERTRLDKTLEGQVQQYRDLWLKVYVQSQRLFVLRKPYYLCRSLNESGAQQSNSQQVSNLQKQVCQLQQEIRDVQSSCSYRIGRLLTFLPRKLRGGMRCIRENGVAYTLGRFKQKLLG